MPFHNPTQQRSNFLIQYTRPFVSWFLHLLAASSSHTAPPSPLYKLHSPIQPNELQFFEHTISYLCTFAHSVSFARTVLPELDLPGDYETSFIPPFQQNLIFSPLHNSLEPPKHLKAAAILCICNYMWKQDGTITHCNDVSSPLP